MGLTPTELRQARVLVTGGSGFIGAHLVRRLLQVGASVHILARPQCSPWRLQDLLVDLVIHHGDVTDLPSVESCMAASRPEVVFHLAGATDARRMDPALSQLDKAIDTNLIGTLNLLRASRHVAPLRCFVRTSGIEEYGNGPLPFQESQREEPVSLYSASQVAATHFSQMLQRQLGLPLVTLRLALAYGPAQSTDFLIPALIAHCLEGRDFAMTSGEQTRDLLYVADIVDACLRAAISPQACGQIFNVASGREYRVLDVTRLVVELCGSRIRLLRGDLPANPGGVQRMCADNQKARDLLGWSPDTNLEEGLRRTIAWYRNAGSAGGSAALE